MNGTPLTQRLRDIASVLSSAQPEQLEDMARALEVAADELSEHITRTRQVYDLFAVVLMSRFRIQRFVDPLNAVAVLTEGEIDEVRGRLQVEINPGSGGDYLVSLVARKADVRTDLQQEKK